MNLYISMKKILLHQSIMLVLVLNFFGLLAQTRQMEYLERGLTAIKTDGGVFLQWRFLGTDGAGTTFNLYRNEELVNALPLELTNFVDIAGSLSDSYRVTAVVGGAELESENERTVKPWADPYKIIPLDRPAGGITPDNVSFTYSPNDCSVGDLDGDGQYEVILKWDPSNSKDNSQSGYTGNVLIDAYTLDGTKLWRIDLGQNIRAGAHYTQLMVYDFDGDGLAELICKTAPGTVDGKGQSVVMGSDNPQTDYRTTSGTILSGPEYLTLFRGKTGEELHTIAYNPPRHPTKLYPTGTELKAIWGDDYGNRQDRFLACVAYLDGQKPSVVMGRGYYTRTCLAAYDVRDHKLVERWFYDSGSTSGVGAYGQGNHNLAVGDVDIDGKDEVIYGACAFDDDGSLLYRTGLGHGDAMHLSDLDPDEAGLELWAVHEDKTAAYGFELHHAGTGTVKWGAFTGTDVGRGLSADIDPNSRGFEMWSTGRSNVYSCKNHVIATSRPSVNFRVYWDGDLQDELLDGTKLDKWKPTGGTDRLMTFYQYRNAKEINGTKANPCLSVDLLGDWREEILYYNSQTYDELLLFATTIPTDYRLYTLMHDPVYRLGVAWQNVAYNQPPHLGFYIGEGLEDIPLPDIYTPVAGPVTSLVSLNLNRSLATIYQLHDKIRVETSSKMQGVEVYSLQGQILHRNHRIEQDWYEFDRPCGQKMIIVKVQVGKNVFSRKITNL